MTGIIHILSEETINQIAAGEVIENPASAVKELVENAIDAQAAHITIATRGGGFQSLIVTDDGVGMSRDDALLCLQRHATSKIFRSSDLASLATMGFRGEALASIAAIAKMSMNTAQKDAMGIQVSVEGGKIGNVEPSYRPQGTTIEVRSLFYNVPARKKFQKSPAVSSAEITRVVTLLALAHPRVGFELVQQDKVLFSLPAARSEDSHQHLLQRRSAELLGEQFAAPLRKLHCQRAEYEIHGLISEPQLTRYNRSGQYLFINNRPVHCPALCFAVRDGYGTRLSDDRHPLFVLHATVAPSLIDVNVHPQKKEVRLCEESLIKQLLRSAVQEALVVEEAISVPPLDFPPFIACETRDFAFEAPMKTSFHSTVHSQMECVWEVQIKPIGLFSYYLIVDAKSLPCYMDEGVVWVDLLAAEARLLFDRLMKKDKPPVQRLLLPETFSCSRAEAEQLLSHVDELEQLGVQIRLLSPTVFMVEAIPQCLEAEEIHDFLHAFLKGSESDQASRICQVVRARKRAFCLEEAVRLCKELMQSQDPYHCPRGKSTLRYIRKEEIENYFTAKHGNPEN